MWGNLQAAIELDTEHPLAHLLFQTTGPASIPLQDSRWQQLLLQYEILVHLDPQSNALIQTACQAMARHAVSSSNLAALTLHVSRMLNDLRITALNFSSNLDDATHKDESIGTNSTSTSKNDVQAQLIGKVRATCGVLNLLRILAHATLESCCSQATTTSRTSDKTDSSKEVDESGNKKTNINPSPSAAISESFTYRENGIMEMRTPNGPRDATMELLYSIISFISIKDPPNELYDATVFSLSLFLVLLSTQLYQPMISTLEILQNHKTTTFKNPLKNVSNYGCNFFLDKILSETYRQMHDLPSVSQSNPDLLGTSQQYDQYSSSSNPKAKWAHMLTSTFLKWIILRPPAPNNTIAADYSNLIQSIVESQGDKPGPDGLYDSHLIVRSSTLLNIPSDQGALESTNGNSSNQSDSNSTASSMVNTSKRGITRVISVSSKLLLLPFRLVRLAMSTIGLIGNQHSLNHLKSMKVGGLNSNQDAIWLSESPVTDLGSSILLLLTSNYRSNITQKLLSNPFCAELALLKDNRWDRSNGLPSSPNLTSKAPLESISSLPLPSATYSRNGLQNSQNMYEYPSEGLQDSEASYHDLEINFESLFESFGCTLHNEMGALLLYTLLQSSSSFSASVGARSDLDKLVMPLLRTLYISSTLRIEMPISSSQKRPSKETRSTSEQDGSASSDESNQTPYRSSSQLYVVLILLLLFSQDLSFGPDAFRRNIIPSISWYKERKLRDISLGSIVVLSLLRSMTFNLNRMNDSFLISNCCAVLLNLSPHIENLHSYAAMRLASVTVFCCKRYVLLARRRSGANANDEYQSMFGMYKEASQTLLQILKHCLRREAIEKSLHLIYALVYVHTDLNETLTAEPSPFKKSEVERILSIVTKAKDIISDTEERLTAVHAMKILHDSVQKLIPHPSDLSCNVDENSFDERSHKDEVEPDFSFTYEEEADPEVFFVPYVWEVIVCVITAGSLEWHRSKVRVADSMTSPEEEDVTFIREEDSSFSKDVSDVV